MNQPALANSYPTPSNTTKHTPTLLVIDDDRSMRMILESELKNQGYNVVEAASAEDGMGILIKNSARIDAIVLDREMPGIGGMEFVARVKADKHLSTIPIIMLTGTGEHNKIQEGIDAGVHYYLVKPFDNDLLKSVVASAIRERLQKLHMISSLSHTPLALKAIKSCQFSVKGIKSAEETACFLASCFPNPERVVSGLLELLVNAVEHGSLKMSFDEKKKLLDENRWQEELERRSNLPEFADKAVEVAYQHKDGDWIVQITDKGDGFDWKRFWHINPARATASHGRGIARARLMAFDRMAYNEKGNSVTVMVSGAPVEVKDYAW